MVENITERLSRAKNFVASRVPDSLSKYTEEYVCESESRLPSKNIFRSGILVHKAFLAEWYFPGEKNYLEEKYTPPFAKGRCIDISDGDYKTVVIDQDGHADYVIKLFGFGNVYRGEKAYERAEAVAKKIAAIYQIIDETSGFRILPNRLFASPCYPASPNDIAVFEVQQRGIFGDHWAIFDPRIAHNIDREIDRGYERFEKITIPELKKRKLVREDIHGLIDHIRLYVSWDFVTNQLVARDVVDAMTD